MSAATEIAEKSEKQKTAWTMGGKETEDGSRKSSAKIAVSSAVLIVPTYTTTICEIVVLNDAQKSKKKYSQAH